MPWRPPSRVRGFGIMFSAAKRQPRISEFCRILFYDSSRSCYFRNPMSTDAGQFGPSTKLSTGCAATVCPAISGYPIRIRSRGSLRWAHRACITVGDTARPIKPFITRNTRQPSCENGLRSNARMPPRKSRPPSATAYERPHQSSAPPAEPRATSPPLAPAVRTEIGPLTTTNPQFKSARSNELLTEAEVVERYRNTISAGTLKNWRSAKRGPAFVKLGRRPLYPKALLERWEEENTVFCDLANGRTRIGDAIG